MIRMFSSGEKFCFTVEKAGRIRCKRLTAYVAMVIMLNGGKSEAHGGSSCVKQPHHKRLLESMNALRSDVSRVNAKSAAKYRLPFISH